MNKENILKIIDTYGVKPQLKYFQSEIFELNESIIEFEDGIGSIEHVIEEISDVLVMINQFIEHYEINNEEIYNVMDYKIKRQIERIENNE